MSSKTSFHPAGVASCAFVIALLGCQAGLGAPPSESGSTRGAPPAVAGDAGMPDVPPPTPRTERCGDGVDDDADGAVDEGCPCEAGDTRPCYGGPPDVRGVGACAEGIQRCDVAEVEFHSWGECTGFALPTREILHNGVDDDCDAVTDEPDGVCVPQADESGARCGDGIDNDCDGFRDCDDAGCVGAPGCPMTCLATERHCSGGHDDDCDGATDCEDAECAADPACMPGPCPAGQTPTYRRRAFPPSYGPSAVNLGDGGPRMPMTCDSPRCEDGRVAVQVSATAFACVPPPPSCPSGQHPHYDGGWGCDEGCELMIHYGGIYGGQNVCAGRPDVSCGAGQAPTFVYETERWACRPVCDDGLYDRRILEGSLVCVPC